MSWRILINILYSEKIQVLYLGSLYVPVQMSWRILINILYSDKIQVLYLGSLLEPVQMSWRILINSTVTCTVLYSETQHYSRLY